MKSNIAHYSTKDGLSHDGVRCITQDRDGFMWFGTFNGLNRFDGTNFVVYKSRPGDTSNKTGFQMVGKNQNTKTWQMLRMRRKLMQMAIATRSNI